VGGTRFRILEPSRNKGRSFHRRGPAELKDLSPTVRSLNDGVTRLCPSADLRERECTLLFSKSDKYDWQRPYGDLKVIFRIFICAFFNWPPIEAIKGGGVM